MGSSLVLIVIALLLVLLNGFFVAAEFGLVKLRPTRVRAIAKAYGWRGRMLAKVHGNLDAYLSACQLGITLASLGLGWIGEPAFAGLLRPLLLGMGIASEQVVHGVAFFFAFFVISYLHIVVGELAPKSLAIRMAETVGIWTAAPLYGFYRLMYPGIWVLNHSANFVLRVIGLGGTPSHDSHYSAEELKLILRSSRPDDKFTGDEWRILAQALDFRELEVSELMRPFSDAVTLSKQDSLATNLDRIAAHRYSRYPYLDEPGQVIGVVHVKDIFLAAHKAALADGLEKLLHPVQTVSPHLSATELLRRFREGASHFAVVAYRNSRPLGFVTLDDLMGVLVGGIRDEFKRSQNEFTRLGDGSLLGKGSVPLFTLEQALGIDIDVEGEKEFDTVGGLVMWKLAALPHEGQRIEFDRFDIVVQKMSGPRITSVQVYPRTKRNAQTSQRE